MIQRNKYIFSPIKSQGKKTKLLSNIKSFITKVSVNGKWIEPFFGSGIVGLNSGFEMAVIGDSNPHIINFFKSIQLGEITANSAYNFFKQEGELLLQSENNGYDYFHTVRDRLNKTFSSLDFLLLTKIGFNGLIRFNNNGLWNVPFCKNQNKLNDKYVTEISSQIENCSKVINSNWKFINSDFENTLENATENDLIYCDPPYYGRHSTYYNVWSEKDEERLFNKLVQTKAKFILSTWNNDSEKENEMIKKFWSKFNIEKIEYRYNIAAKSKNRKSITEALIFNF